MRICDRGYIFASDPSDGRFERRGGGRRKAGEGGDEGASERA